MILKQPKCFTETQWKIYLTEIQAVKNNKNLDICFDCTVDYQSSMRKQGKCEFPMKRLNKIAEYT